MEWICKQYKRRKFNHRASRYDVSITDIKCGSGLIFRNDCGVKFDDGVDFAIDGNRLYFRNVKSGYKLQPTNNTRDIVHLYIKTNQTVSRLLLDFEGSYDLNYDGKLGLYYIEKGVNYEGE